jgi:hypothetical protein
MRFLGRQTVLESEMPDRRNDEQVPPLNDGVWVADRGSVGLKSPELAILVIRKC